MRSKAILISLISLLAGPALGAEAEKQIWACRTEHEGSKPILHLVEWENRSYVKFASARFGAQYRTEDDTQGWYFNNDGSGYYRYGVVLDQDGKAWFHDFRETDDEGLSVPLDYFRCSKTS